MRNKVLIVIASLLAIAFSASAGAISPPQATYVGSNRCQLCHGGMNANIVSGWRKSAHSRSFFDAAKNPESIRAMFSEDSPVKKEQIKYVIASGRTHQAYIGADMKTLPAEWNTLTKKWDTVQPFDAKTQCISCHVTGYKTADATWAEPAVGCESCHGPGSAHASQPSTKNITTGADLPDDRKMMVCGQCHARGADPTKTYAFPVNFRPGDDLAKFFTLATIQPCAQNQQYNEMLTSKHYTAAKMRCGTCHDPHGATTTQPAQLRKPVNELCLGCHTNIKSVKDHAPQAIANATCATCHMPGGSHEFKTAAK